MTIYKSLEEALKAKIDLTEQLQGIDQQLSQRAATVSGRLAPKAEYQAYMEWKGRAVGAKRVLVNKLQKCKLQIAQLRSDGAKKRIAERGNEKGLLSDLYSLTKALVAAGADITGDEQSLLDDVRSHLES